MKIYLVANVILGALVVGCSGSSDNSGSSSGALAVSAAPLDAGQPRDAAPFDARASTIPDAAPPSTDPAATDWDDGGACALAISLGAPACDACATQHCCGVTNTCARNAECVALDACVTQCIDLSGGPSCEDACYAAHPEGTADFGAANQCIQVSCSSVCN